MEYDQNERNETDQQTPQYDPAGETKKKLLFFVVAIVVVVAAKFILGL
mgnify:CR=1 FL=1